MKPALVLLPGMDGTGCLFAPITAALGEDVESMVVRYPDEELDYSAHEAIARAALPLERPHVLLGESFSGSIAISIAPVFVESSSIPATRALLTVTARLTGSKSWTTSAISSDGRSPLNNRNAS